MALITMSGNVLSLSLGVTTGAAAMVFSALSGHGAVVAVLGTVIFSIAVVGVQGFIVGYFRANPIIVSIAALGLTAGFAEITAGGRTIYAGQRLLGWLSSNVYGVPMTILVFIVAALLVEIMLLRTRFGRKLIMVGSNVRAADAAGLVVWKVVVGVYACAGLLVGLAAIMLAARYGMANMEFGLGYDYQAIAAVLVGGIFIGGGEGSATRAVTGMTLLAVLSSVVVLYGVSSEYQALVLGLVVLISVLLQRKKS
ncbi:ABC transporter permease [Mesorhizobium sp. L-8-10]|uniref:ABC transporter permease n=1 Tax=Mesorhizobium sp. L-8-10 TaxID=2744523 RepID=UPI0019370A63|nr:ABC transporter permease [Mesorhizobium sp. L-8-10]BCH29374.1 ABC transporter permease [Mesorhizobium sp. L-8-10]